MKIDIVNYSEDQLAALSAEKLLEVREIQLKKDKLSAQLQEKLAKEKRKLIDRGAYPSDLWAKMEEEWTAEYEQQVELLRESLIFFLHYVADDAPMVYPDAPYTVDYSLSEEERLLVVKKYYEDAYADEYERYSAFKKDAFAKVYLGELYSPLHDYFYRAG